MRQKSTFSSRAKSWLWGAVGMAAFAAGALVLAMAGTPFAQWILVAAATGFCLILAMLLISLPTISPKGAAARLNAPLVAALPLLTPREARLAAPDERGPADYVAARPASPLAQGFERLRAQIFDASGEHPAKIVAFTGLSGQEGATTATLGLAHTLALRGKRVLVVDCDIRRHGLTMALGLAPQVGVLEVARGDAAWTEAVTQNVGSGFDVMGARRPLNPFVDLATQPRLPEFFSAITPHYDAVLLDCPPVAASLEARFLARRAHRAVLVLRWRKIKFGIARGAVRTLTRHRSATLAGVLVNFAPSSNAGLDGDHAKAAKKKPRSALTSPDLVEA